MSSLEGQSGEGEGQTDKIKKNGVEHLREEASSKRTELVTCELFDPFQVLSPALTSRMSVKSVKGDEPQGGRGMSATNKHREHGEGHRAPRLKQVF